jgi:hypothetical protein
MSVKLSNIKLYENPFSGYSVVACGQANVGLHGETLVFLQLHCEIIKTCQQIDNQSPEETSRASS